MGEISLKAADRNDQQGEHQGLDESAPHVDPVHAGIDAIEIGARIGPEQDHPADVAAQDADQVEEGRQDRETDDRRGDPRADEVAERVDAHRGQGIDLLGDALDADLGGHGRAGPGGDHDGREHGAELADQRQGDRGAQKPHRAEFVHDIVKLKPQHHPREKPHHHHDARRPGPDEVDLVDDVPNQPGLEDQHHGPREENGHGAQGVVQADGEGPEGVEESQPSAAVDAAGLREGGRGGSGCFRHHTDSIK